MPDQVLVLGGGLAGVACAHTLGDEGVEVTLVDRNDYHQFQPLLYQVATSQLPAEDIARPHRTIFRDYPTVEVVTAEVATANLAERGAACWPTGERCPGRTWWWQPAPGRTSSAFRAPPSTRSRCTRSPTPSGCGCTCGGCWRQAEQGADLASGRSTSSWSEADRPGSRPAGALAELMHALASTGRLDAPGQITMVDRGQALLGPVLRQGRTSTPHEKLTEAGRRVKLETGVTAVHPDRVEFDDGSTDHGPDRRLGRRRVAARPSSRTPGPRRAGAGGSTSART